MIRERDSKRIAVHVVKRLVAVGEVAHHRIHERATSPLIGNGLCMLGVDSCLERRFNGSRVDEGSIRVDSDRFNGGWVE